MRNMTKYANTSTIFSYFQFEKVNNTLELQLVILLVCTRPVLNRNREVPVVGGRGIGSGSWPEAVREHWMRSQAVAAK